MSILVVSLMPPFESKSSPVHTVDETSSCTPLLRLYTKTDGELSPSTAVEDEAPDVLGHVVHLRVLPDGNVSKFLQFATRCLMHAGLYFEVDAFDARHCCEAVSSLPGVRPFVGEGIRGFWEGFSVWVCPSGLGPFFLYAPRALLFGGHEDDATFLHSLLGKV